MCLTQTVSLVSETSSVFAVTLCFLCGGSGAYELVVHESNFFVLERLYCGVCVRFVCEEGGLPVT